MAAKQGLSAQWSQASEDAKRALSMRTKSSWFSNLNTTCTIKSAPPRSPEVLSLLSVKSGYLLKRNEQHIWQSRWCCIVPHMFLYYFDADIGIGNNSNSLTSECIKIDPPSLELQQELNSAINTGKRKSTAPRSSLNLFPSTAAVPEDAPKDKFSTLQPTGIVDLECYTCIHRPPSNPLILELAGDDNVNPDLRSFYFCAADEDHGEEWSQALLGERHNSLVDERDAYRQVCDGFSLQLQKLHSDLDKVEKKYVDAQEECYRIRSSHEEVRRKSFSVIQEALERPTNGETAQHRRAFRTDLETVRQQGMGLVPAVQLLSDFCAVLEDSCQHLAEKVKEQEESIQRVHDGDHLQSKELDSLLKEKEKAWLLEKQELQKQVSQLENQLNLSQKAAKDAQQDLASQKMEYSIYHTSSKAKIAELVAHKKILKKEVINLRQKLDEVESELDLLKHHSQVSRAEVETERRKAELLERYVEKMESQVKVQQNMMEIISQTQDNSSRASASLYGGSQQQFGAYGAISNTYHLNPPNTLQNVMVLGMEDNGTNGETHSVMLRKAMAPDDYDNKSHMSELTEDRTQKHFIHESREIRIPPSFIDAANSVKLETISASAGYLPPRSLPTERKLSVAQRARMEAEKGSPVRIRVATPKLTRSKSISSQSSILDTFDKSLTDALDSNGPGYPDAASTTSSPQDDTEDEENERPLSEASLISLSQRQQIQRAKQIAFLKAQGLLKTDNLPSMNKLPS
jgi:PH domain